MKRIFLIFVLLSGISCALEKAKSMGDKQPHLKANTQACVGAASSFCVHTMMKDRNLAFYNAWMIMWAEFPEEFDKLVQNK